MNLNQVSIVLTFIVTFTFDFINSQQYVSLTTDSLVNFREEKLPFTCTPQSLATSGAISSITLQKKQSNGLYNDVVKVFLDIAGTITNQTIWTDTTMQSLASVNKSYVNPSSSAGLQFEIAADRVRCDFSGEYRCAITGTSSTGSSLASESPSRNVSMSVSPISINHIQRSPQQSENIYNANCGFFLSCSRDVGNPAQNLRWCIFRNGLNSGFISYPTSADITQGTASYNSNSCQYRRTSTLRYNVSADYSSAEFRCETGGTTTTCAHSSAIAANITITKYTPTQTEDPDDPDTPFNAAVTGGVIGASVAIVLTIVIAFIVYSKAFKTKHAVNPCIETSNDRR